MDTCVADVVYESDSVNKVYFKKIILCGIVRGRALVKEIVYNYPCKGIKNSSLSVGLGNLDIRKNDSELGNILNQFKLVIVNSKLDAAYFRQYCSSEVVIVERNEYTPIDERSKQ